MTASEAIDICKEIAKCYPPFRYEDDSHEIFIKNQGWGIAGVFRDYQTKTQVEMIPLIPNPLNRYDDYYFCVAPRIEIHQGRYVAKDRVYNTILDNYDYYEKYYSREDILKKLSELHMKIKKDAITNRITKIERDF